MGGTGPRLGAYTMGSTFFNFLASVRTKPEIWKYASNAMFHRSVMSVHQSLGQSTLGQTSIVGSFLASCMLPATFNRAVCLNESVWVWLIQVFLYTCQNKLLFRVMCGSQELAGKLVCEWVGSSVKSKIWPITFVWIGNVNLLGLSRHVLEWLVRTHDQKLVSLLSASCQSTPCEADVK